ncbi:MAG: hypothetical protein ACRDKV_07980, partial [Solirubrobacterales bacterium]
AEFELTTVAPEPRREALATVRLTPRDAAEEANWLYVLAWQGSEDRIVDRMRRVAEGVYRSTEPIPLYGNWKAGLRLQAGRERGAVPIRLPADPGIGPSSQPLPVSFTDVDAATEAIRGGAAGAELPAPASFTRAFLDDSLIVLREQNGDVPSWLWALAISAIAAIYAIFVAALALGVARFARANQRRGPPPARPPDLAAEPAREGARIV